MSETCNHDCESCEESCKDGQQGTANLMAEANEMSHVKKVIAIASGKGGVGKSLVTTLLASSMQKKGYQCAVLDADITGPSIPRAFQLHERAQANQLGIFPVKTRTGISVMSLNLLLENETDPVIWRGPIIADMVRQFWTDVIWEDEDYMFVDMPPGTGDVPLTVFQSLPVDGVIIVTSPQALVGMIVEKAVNMARTMNVPVLGIVENMSYVKCPDCGKEIRVFGESHIEETALKYQIDTICRLPIRPELAALADTGRMEEAEEDGLTALTDKLMKL